MKLSSKVQTLQALLVPAAEASGVQLWGIEFQRLGRKSLLRIYIDVLPSQTEETVAQKEGEELILRGISAEDCARMSHQVSGILDVHDPIDGEYVLEVSSPGWERPFFTIEQMVPFIGQKVQLRLIVAVQNRRKVVGKLLSVSEQNHLQVEVDGQVLEIEASNVDKANLVYED